LTADVFQRAAEIEAGTREPDATFWDDAEGATDGDPLTDQDGRVRIERPPPQ
jgi:hypothetical protein